MKRFDATINIVLGSSSFAGLALFLGVQAFYTGALSANVVAAPSTAPPAPTMRALVVGGGPSSDYNQVSISKNVRYVRRLLAPRTPHLTFFATGNANDATVLEGADELPANESLLHLILNGSDASFSTPHYAKPQLGGPLDGASSPAQIKRAFTWLNRENRAKPLPVLLYFTGHGGPGMDRSKKRYDYENNTYGLWDDDELTVRELAKYIGELPSGVPVTLVMVQCYSGGFGNVLFKDGNPQGPLVARDIAGFFATVKDHTAAGCTSEVNEKEYRDFTSYFFAALCGQDRVGRRVTGADYNHDGRVGMDEAYYYTVAHDVSIDIPTATSDVFLRRFVPATEREILSVPYAQILGWASPAQKAALAELSTRLKLTGDDRTLQAYRQLFGSNWATEAYRSFTGSKPQKMEEFQAPEGASEALTSAWKEFYWLWQQERKRFLRRYPALANPRGKTYASVRKQALVQLDREGESGQWRKLTDSYDKLMVAYSADEKEEIGQSLLLRFLRLSKTIVLEHRLKSGQNAAIKQRFVRLQTAEARSPLPYLGAPANVSPKTSPNALASRFVSSPSRRELDGCGCGIPSARPTNTSDSEW